MNHSDHKPHVHKPNYKKGYIVLFGILATILAASLGLGYSKDEPIMWVMSYFMGFYFLVFGAFKVRGLKMFAVTYQGYDLIAKRSKAYSYVYPFIELALGVLFIFRFFELPVNVFTFLLMSISAIGVASKLGGKNKIHCACLGEVVKLPLTTISLFENVVMAVMSLIMILMLV